MDWSLDRKRPIAPQLCEQLCVQISAGVYPAGCRLPSVRDIALSAGVNPNTVQKALEMLGNQGIIYSERGSGWYVGDGADAALGVKNDVIYAKTAEFFDSLRALGMDDETIKNYVKEWKQ